MAALVTARDRPRLICDEPEYCFGTLSNTNDVPHTFVLANEGAVPLAIYRVQADCGCTRVRLEDKIIHPGEQTTVQVRLILKGRAGGQHKRVTIESNDPDQPRLVLSLIGKAVAEVELKPDRLYWGNLRSDAEEVKTVDIRFDESVPGHITGAGVNSPAFAVDLETNKSGMAYRLRIRPVPPLVLGRFATNVWITTDSPRYPQISVPMQGRVVGDIYTVPDELWLASDTTQSVSRLLMVQSSRKQNFKIVRVEPPLPGVEVTVRSTLFKGYRIELKNLQPLRELNGRALIIITDCATMPEIIVPFRIGAPPGAAGQ
ncbi:MAG: DUF1573 domain-containing protein [Kiritimatiellota bacterium]|nr:DUF1573 domain-containing protein [Kiritimatiellota bacterium]